MAGTEPRPEASARPRRIRIARALLVAALIAVLLPLMLLAFIAMFDWNRAKPWLATRASAALGRAVAIDGDFDVAWQWRRGDGDDAAWSPGLRLRASGVRVANADWARTPSVASFERLEVDVRALPLLWHRIDMPTVRVAGPYIDVERRADGSDNWSFESAGSGPHAWSVELGDVVFDAGEVDVRDAQRELDVHATIEPLAAPIAFGERVEGDDPSTRRDVIQRVGRAAAQRLRDAAAEREQRRAERGRPVKPPPYRFGFTAKGTLAGMELTAKGRLGGALALRRPEPFPLRADIDVGSTAIALTGTITNPASPDAIDMRLWISGRNLAQLYDILGIALPNSPPYVTVGRLAGRFSPNRSALRYEDFAARVGGSDLAGTLAYRSGEPRPTLRGDVDSTLLRLRDLGAVVGAGSAEDRAARGDRTKQPAGRVLPAEPFEVEHWRAADADVHFTGKRVIRNEEQPISDVDTRIRMQDGVLTLEPLRFGMAGGRVDGRIRVDSGPRPARGSVKLSARKLALARLFEASDGLSESLGQVNGDIALDGSGGSIAAILGSANGSLKLVMTDGQVSESTIEKAGLNVLNAFFAKLRGDPLVRIDCAAAVFSVDRGRAVADLFVFDTENARIDIEGTLDLGRERVDLVLRPRANGLRMLTLRSPLRVSGTFEHVDVEVEKKALLLRVGAAIGLGVAAAPAAAAVPLIAPGSEEEKQCAPLLAEVGKARRTGETRASGKPVEKR
jgi:uncharacterized protein involved in outer membrane biogenesis